MMKNALLLVTSLVCWAVAIGCNPLLPTAQPTVPAKGASTQQQVALADEAPKEVELGEDGRREFWDAIYIQGKKVGYAGTRIEAVALDGQQMLRYVQISKLTVKRFNQAVLEHTTKVETVETPGGKLVSFKTKSDLGQSLLEIEGKVDGEKLTFDASQAGRTRFGEIDWQEGWGSFFAIERAIEQRPLKPGESRELTALMMTPAGVTVADIAIKAGDWEMTKLRGGGEAKLLRLEISQKPRRGAAGLNTLGWMDQRGIVRKQQVPGAQMEYFRTGKDDALGEVDNVPDLALDMSVPVKRKLNKPHATSRIVYRVKLNDANPAKLFSNGESQSVESINENEARLTVLSIRADVPEKLTTESKPPTEDDLNPNAMIESDDETIAKMATAIAANERDPWKVAVALERYTANAIETKDFSTAFATAAEVARSRQGDCSEHAVLLAALCRARKIPARVAIGLIYYNQIYAYHMWTEVWTGDRWVPLDATLGQGGIGAAHVKVAHSNMAETSGLEALLPVANLLGNLEMEIIEVE